MINTLRALHAVWIFALCVGTPRAWCTTPVFLSSVTNVNVGLRPVAMTSMKTAFSDYRPKIVVANQVSQSLTVLRIIGSQVLVLTNLDLPSEPFSVSAMESGGTTRLIVAHYVTSSITSILGSTQDIFSVSGTNDVGNHPASAAVGNIGVGPRLYAGVSANFYDDTVTVVTSGTNFAGNFQTLTNLPTGPGPRFVLLTGINSDGAADIIVANSGNDTVTEYTSQTLVATNGQFSRPNISPVGHQPVALALGDFNRDLRPDLVTANVGDNTVTVARGEGGGLFFSPVSYPVGNNPVSVAVGDLNGDGFPDVIAANSLDSTLTVLLNRGDGSFFVYDTIPTVANPQVVSIADVFNDPARLRTRPPDVIVLGGDGSVAFLRNNGATRLAITQTNHLARIAWPAYATNCLLDSFSNLTWLPVPGVFGLESSQRVYYDGSGGSKIFRLRQQK